jgi:hypothetical protein
MVPSRVNRRALVVTWFTMALSRADVAAGDVGRIQDALAELLVDAGAPPGAALFGVVRDDENAILYFTPAASRIAERLLKERGARACLPPVNEGHMVLLVGAKGDQRLLNS